MKNKKIDLLFDAYKSYYFRNNNKQQANKMADIMTMYFNGTGVMFPMASLKIGDVCRMAKQSISPRAYDEQGNIDRGFIEDMYNKMVEWENLLCQFSEYGRITENTFNKVSAICGLMTPNEFATAWCFKVILLVKAKRIPNDKNNGFEIFMSPTIEKRKELFGILQENCKNDYHNDIKEAKRKLLCSVCNIKAKATCKCGMRHYCCQKHQKTDWVEHKLYCFLEEKNQRINELLDILNAAANHA